MSRAIRWGPFWNRKVIMIPDFNLETMCSVHGTRLAYMYRTGGDGWIENRETGDRTPIMHIPAYMIRYCGRDNCVYQCVQDIPNKPIETPA